MVSLGIAACAWKHCSFCSLAEELWAPWTVRVQNQSMACVAAAFIYTLTFCASNEEKKHVFIVMRWAKVSLKYLHMLRKDHRTSHETKKRKLPQNLIFLSLKWRAWWGNRREPLRKTQAHLQAAIIVRFPTTKWCCNDHEITNCCAPKKHFQKVLKYTSQKPRSAEV